RVGDTFSDVYLMVLGAIQGLAVAAFVSSLAETVVHVDLRQVRLDPAHLDWLPLAIRYFLTLTAIFIVTFEYTWDVAAFRRYPRYRHVIGPLTLGMFEILPIFFVADPAKWWLASGLFSATGVVSYLITLSVFGNNFELKSHGYRRTTRLLVSNSLITLVST